MSITVIIPKNDFFSLFFSLVFSRSVGTKGRISGFLGVAEKKSKNTPPQQFGLLFSISRSSSALGSLNVNGSEQVRLNEDAKMMPEWLLLLLF